MYRDPSRAPDLARSPRIGSTHLHADGIVDEIVSEAGGLGRSIARAIARNLAALSEEVDGERIARRRNRFAALTPYIGSTLYVPEKEHHDQAIRSQTH